MQSASENKLQPALQERSLTLERTTEEIRSEITGKFGFIPPFFEPAQSAQVLENLWQQTLSAYINNPLPALFKEKLSAYLSRDRKSVV